MVIGRHDSVDGAIVVANFRECPCGLLVAALVGVALLTSEVLETVGSVIDTCADKPVRANRNKFDMQCRSLIADAGLCDSSITFGKVLTRTYVI